MQISIFKRALHSIWNSVFSLIKWPLIFPMTLIIKVAFENSGAPVSIDSIFRSLSKGLWLAFGVFYFIAIILAFYFRDKGLRLLHELENEDT